LVDGDRGKRKWERRKRTPLKSTCFQISSTYPKGVKGNKEENLF
jgi:hypothetical protein